MIKSNKSNRRWKKRLTKSSISSYHLLADGAPLNSVKWHSQTRVKETPFSQYRRSGRKRTYRPKSKPILDDNYQTPIAILPDYLTYPKTFLSSNNQTNIDLVIIDKHYYCYLLQSISRPRRTYFGMTTNLKHRLRQHNGEISGGAKSTRNGKPWRMIAYISGFASKVEALRFEWRVHHPGMKWTGIPGRIKIINKVITEKKWVIDDRESLLIIAWLGTPSRNALTSC